MDNIYAIVSNKRYRFIGLFCASALIIWALYGQAIPGEYFKLKGMPHLLGEEASQIPQQAPLPPQRLPNTWAPQAERVKDAFLHAWNGYEKYAMPEDELMPVSNRSITTFNGWGVTLFDSLDTMLLMGLDDEFKRALPHVEKMTFPSRGQSQFFETVIRYLGGLPAAYALSHEKILLDKADQLAKKLDPVFNSPHGFPYWGVSTEGAYTTGNTVGNLAEIATLQVEYLYLAKMTGNKKWYDNANKVNKIFKNADLKATGGMLPGKWDLNTGKPVDTHLSVGMESDSAHEYLLKQYILTGKHDTESLKLYLRATTQIITKLMYLSPKRRLLFATDIRTDPVYKHRPSYVFEHLSCFLPGLFALGAHTLPLDDLASLGIDYLSLADSSNRAGFEKLSKFNLKDLHLWAAEGLAETCWLFYGDQKSGLGSEEIYMDNVELGEKDDEESFLWVEALARWKRSGARGAPPGVEDHEVILDSGRDAGGKGHSRDYKLKRNEYFLRPETVESLYVVWRVTGDKKWRDRGWKIFEAIEKHCRTGSGFSSVRSVIENVPPKMDSMPSYFMAETLKYLYLLFTDEDLVPLDKWVFNTEAHPVPVFEWTAQEKKKFGIH